MTVLQIFLASKGVDAVAITAAEAIRTLLGYGDRLGGLTRHQLIEVHGAGDPDRMREPLLAYLEHTFELWNQNKERCWVRTVEGSWEIVPGRPPRSVEAVPGIAAPSGDHLVLWSRPERELDPLRAPVPAAAGADGPGGAGSGPEVGAGLPRDFPPSLGGSEAHAVRGEVYTFLWSGPGTSDDRRGLVSAAGAVRNRGEGLLVQPQYQGHEVVIGPVPLPVWSRSGHDGADAAS